MAQKQCTKCGQCKDEEEFAFRRRSKNNRHSACRECEKILKDNWYRNNKERQRANAIRSKNTQREVLRQYVIDYLSNHPCTVCGESDPVVLEFHHVRGKKIKTISEMVARAVSIQKIQEEIDKCNVVCSNCHRRITTKEKGWFRGRV